MSVFEEKHCSFYMTDLNSKLNPLRLLCFNENTAPKVSCRIILLKCSETDKSADYHMIVMMKTSSLEAK